MKKATAESTATTLERKPTKAGTMATEINKEKLKALQLTMDKMDKTFGKGAVMKLGMGL